MAQSITINPVDGDNFINNSQAGSGITITGSATPGSGASAVGQQVTVTLNGKTYTGTINGSDDWSVSVGSTDLEALTDGSGYTVSASYTDTLGNHASNTDTVTVDKKVTLTMAAVDGNNLINNSQAASGITITGTATGSTGLSDVVGQTVTVTLNGKTYTGTVTSTGAWSVSVPSADLEALTDGTGYAASAKITDVAGNTASAGHTATVDKTATLVMNVVDGNNYIDATEYANGITITGTANDSIGLSGVSGRTVSVTFNGQTYTGTVSSTGTWSVSVPSSATSALVDGGKYLATAKMTDVAGNLVASVHNVTVDLKTYLVVNPFGANPSGIDSYVNINNAASGITINGTATDDIGLSGVVGRTVTITWNGKSYTSIISSTGTWSVNVPSADLEALTNGTVYNVVGAYSDYAGNNVSENRFVTVDRTAAIDTNLVDGNNFILSSNIASGITISGVATDGLSVSGEAVTVTLNGKTYNTTVSSTGTWSVNVGSADLGALTDKTTYNVVASASDAAGNNLSYTDAVTVHKTEVNWGTSTGNWDTNTDWVGSTLPSSTDLAGLNLTTGETVTYNTGTSTVDGIILSGAGTLLVDGGTLNVTHALDVQGGTLQLSSSGTLGNATLIYDGGKIALNGITLNNVTVDGTMDMSTNSYYAYVSGGLKLNGAEGYGAGAINLTAISDTLYFEGSQTLDNATITLGSSTGYSDFIYNYDTTDTGSVLTFGKNLTVNDNSYAYAYLDSTGSNFTGDGIVNEGTINVEGTNHSQLYIIPYNFTNEGTINVATNATLYLEPNVSMTNSVGGNITVSSGGTMTLGTTSDTVSNAGTITATGATLNIYNLTNTGTLDITDSTVHLYGSYSYTLLNEFAGGSDTIYIDGVLNNTSNTLTLGTGSAIGDIILASDGTINGGTIVDQGSGVSFQGGIVENVTYDGTMNLSANSQYFSVEGGLTTHAQNGTGNGTINLTGTSDYIVFEGSQTFDKATITLGSATGYSDFIYSDDTTDTGGVLTLGTNLTINDNSEYYVYLDSTGYDFSGDGIVNKGTINVEGTNHSQLYVVPYNFTNEGTITVDGGATLFLDPSVSVTNASGGHITVDSGATMQLGNTSDAVSNAGTITATGATLDIYNLTNTGTLDVTDSTVHLYGSYTDSLLNLFAGDTIYIDGTLTNTANTLTVGTGSTLGDIILASDGTILGGTIVDQGSGIVFSGGILNDVTYDGTMDLSPNNSTVYVVDSLTTHAENGTGKGTVNLTGISDDIVFEGNQTFDNATVTLGSPTGYSDFIYNYDTNNTGSVLTLGTNLTVNDNSYAYAYLDSTGYNFTGDGIDNKGTINVEGTNHSTLYVATYNFTNQGTITVDGGATLNFDGNISLTNASGGNINVDSGGTMIFGDTSITATNAGTISGTDATITFYNLTGSGTYTITNSTIKLYGTYTPSQIPDSSSDGNTFDLYGTINNASATITFGGSSLTNGVLESGGIINNGTIVDMGSGMAFSGGTLNSVTYDGTMNLSTNSQTALIEGSLTTHATNGTGNGTINLTATSDYLYFEGNQTLNNATVTLGSSTGYSDILYNYDNTSTGSVLTLGSGLTVNDNSYAYAYLDSAGAGESGDGIINKGIINVEGTSTLYINPYNFTNQGTINVASGTTLYVEPSTSFNNAGTIVDNSGTVYVDKAETGTAGNFDINGTGIVTFTGASTDDVTFGSGATGDLILDSSVSFTGKITGFAGLGSTSTSDKIDLKDINFATATKSYSGGILTVSDGTHTANITFVGSYVPANFSIVNDGSNGTLVYDPPVASPSTSTDTIVQKFVQSMASFGADNGSGTTGNNLEPHIISANNVTNPVHLHH